MFSLKLKHKHTFIDMYMKEMQALLVIIGKEEYGL